MQFTGFKQEGLAFLKKILINNSKEWLDEHRDEYEKLIVEPNKAYVEEMGEHLQVLVPTINAVPKINKSLFKIYRDARYHPLDPIKTRIGIIFWQGGGHRMQSSSFYMHYDSEEVFLAVGIRNFKSELLNAYRSYIKNEEKREALHKILESLKLKGYSIPEPQYKRLPQGFDNNDKHSYLAKYKAMYIVKTYVPDNDFCSEKVINKNFKYYEEMFPLQEWVYELSLTV